MPNQGKRAGKKSPTRKAKESSYWARKQNILNKMRKLKKHIRIFPNDKTAKSTLDKIQI